jgi:hypothetical protein
MHKNTSIDDEILHQETALEVRLHTSLVALSLRP